MMLAPIIPPLVTNLQYSVPSPLLVVAVAAGALPDGARVTEAGDIRVTEAGDIRVTE